MRLAIAIASLWCLLGAAPPADEEEEEDEPTSRTATGYDFSGDLEITGEMMPAPAAASPMELDSGTTLGATPGVLRGMAMLRSLVESGQIPSSAQCAPETFFAEHDLPIESGERCEQLLCVQAEATDAALVTDPSLQYLVQIGFSSMLVADSFVRDPLDLVLLIDTSSSMQGRPLELVSATVATIRSKLNESDRLSIVTFDRESRVLVRSSVPGDPAIDSVLSHLYGTGASNLGAGLHTAFNTARVAARGPGIRTRVMVFTDDRPNFGAIDLPSFIAMARAASNHGIGLTTIGVGVAFDAAIARELASVKGGSALSFLDVEGMLGIFDRDFDTMVTELAHGLRLVVQPKPGLRVTRVYGIPESAVERVEHGVAIKVETVFASRNKGALYVGISPIGRPNLPREPTRAHRSLGEVRLTYSEVEGAQRFHSTALATRAIDRASQGLRRGSVLLDQALAIGMAVEAHHGGKERQPALHVLRAVSGRAQHGTADVRGEADLVAALLSALE